jgi:hypothetical protein
MPENETTSVQASLILEIERKNFELVGEIGKTEDNKPKIIVEYNRPFDQALLIGTIDQLIVSVAAAMNLPGGFADSWTKVSTDVKTVPLLGPVFDRLTETPIRITNLVINTVMGKYEFGFAFDFKNSTKGPVTLGPDFPLKLDAFGLKVTHEKTKDSG